MEFSKKIKFLRKKAGLTQKDLASKLGVSIASLQNYEYGKTIPSAGTLSKLSKNLDLHYSIFASEDNDDLLSVFNAHEYDDACRLINSVIDNRIKHPDGNGSYPPIKFSEIFNPGFYKALEESSYKPSKAEKDFYGTDEWINFYCKQLNEDALDKVLQFVYDLASDKENLNEEFLKKLEK